MVRRETKPPGIENAESGKVPASGNVFSPRGSLKRPQRGFLSESEAPPTGLHDRFLLHHQSNVLSPGCSSVN